MKKIHLLLTLIIIQINCFSITIIKNVGHGDCYVVISDGRIIVIDAGSELNANGLVSLLKSNEFQYDRIVITHVHSDHVGGLITANQYLKSKGSVLKADMLISNHGEHDLNIVIRESNLKSLMTEMRSPKIVVMSDEALNRFALNDDNISIEGIMLNTSKQSKNENLSGLIIKVTEIRDGIKRATLFLGDIEKSIQKKLFTHPKVNDIFKDVYAVTIPHHGRPKTLSGNFFEKIKKYSGTKTILMHSDRYPLEEKLALKASGLGFIIKSTSETKNDVYINLFNEEKTFHLVGEEKTSISELVQKESSKFRTTDSKNIGC